MHDNYHLSNSQSGVEINSILSPHVYLKPPNKASFSQVEHELNGELIMIIFRASKMDVGIRVGLLRFEANRRFLVTLPSGLRFQWCRSVTVQDRAW